MHKEAYAEYMRQSARYCDPMPGSVRGWVANNPAALWAGFAGLLAGTMTTLLVVLSAGGAL